VITHTSPSGALGSTRSTDTVTTAQIAAGGALPLAPKNPCPFGNSYTLSGTFVPDRKRCTTQADP
jgi:hypothetical protein